MKIWPFFRPDGDGPGQFFGGHDEDDEENVFDWCHMVVLGIKGLTRFLVRSDLYQKCGKHTQKRNDGKSLAPKVFFPNGTTMVVATLKKTLTINHLKQVGEEILFRQTKGKMKVK